MLQERAGLRRGEGAGGRVAGDGKQPERLLRRKEEDAAQSRMADAHEARTCVRAIEPPAAARARNQTPPLPLNNSLQAPATASVQGVCGRVGSHAQ